MPQDKLSQQNKVGIGQNLNQKGNQKKVFQSLDLDIEGIESDNNHMLEQNNIGHDQWLDDQEYRAIYRQKYQNKNTDKDKEDSIKSAEFSLPSLSEESGEICDRRNKKVTRLHNKMHSVDQSADVKMFLDSGEFNNNNNFLDPNKPLAFIRKRERSLKIQDDESDCSELEKNFQINYEQKHQQDEKRIRMMFVGQIQADLQKKEAQNDDFFMLIEKNSLEKIEDMTGRCLTFRKTIFKLKTHTHHLAHYIISSKPFDWVCLFVILCNSIQLAVEDPSGGSSAATPEILTYLDTIFLVFYTTEMILKIIGMGFFMGKSSYLRSPWNILDFVIVNTGLLQIFLSGTKINLSGLRAFRILRPLKTISGIEGLKIIVTALISSSQNLIEAFIVLYIGYMIFSITGLQLFMGYFKQRCVSIEYGTPHPSDDLCGKQECPAGYVCGKANTNPNYEQTNFDTIFYSFISVYQAVSLEGWTYTMKDAQKAYSAVSWAFFCPLTYIVAFFLLQLTQAVISNAFQNQHESNDGNEKVTTKKKKKVLKDFDNLDDKERQELLEAQEEDRKIIMKKWRRIYTVKSGLIRFIQAFKWQKKQNQQELVKEERQKFRKNKQTIFKILSKDDAKPLKEKNVQKLYKLDSTSLNATTSQNNKSNFESRKPNQFDKLPVYMKNLRSVHVKQEDQQLERYLTSPDKVMRMMGMVGIKQANDNIEDQLQKDTARMVEKHLYDSEHYNKNAFNLNDLDLFQEIQYGQQSSDNLSDISYFSIDHSNIKDNTKAAEQRRPPLEITSDMESNIDDKCPTPIKSTTTQNSNHQLKDKNVSTNDSAAMIAKEFNQRKEQKIIRKRSPEVFRNLHKSISITKKQPQNSNYEIKSEFRKGQEDNDESQIVSNFDETIMNQKEGGKSYLNQTGEVDLQCQSLVDVTNLNKTLMNDTATNLMNNNHLYESQKSMAESTKLKTQMTLLNQSSLKRYYGPNTIGIRDYLPIQENLLNYKFQVLEDIGKDRKIYLRKDKIDLLTPAQDIFEQRQKQKDEKNHEESIKESVNYLSDLIIRPYQRKCYLNAQVIIPDEEQTELLAQLYMEPMDLPDLIQQQYNKFYISNLYVTGTLSITIQNNAEEGRRNNIRKLQNQGLINEENENQLATQLVNQYLQMQRLSRGSDNKSCLSNTDRSLAFFNSQQNSEHTETQQKMSASGNNKQFRGKTLPVYNQKHGSSLGFKKASGRAQTDVNENQSALRKRIQLNKKAAKDADLQRKMIIKKITKDAMKSTLFRIPIIKAKSTHNRIFFFPDVPDSDEEDHKEENEDESIDEFLDIEFDCDIEVLRAKKNALSKKIGRVEWSGQDVLTDFDPSEAKFVKDIISMIRVWPKDLYRYFKISQVSIKIFVTGPLVDNTMTLCVLFNTICLSMDRYGIDTETSNFLQQANQIFTYIFISEMTLKIVGLGIVKYLKDKMNYMDGTIVILSLVEICMSSKTGALSAFRSIRIFRTFRVLRITRLLRTMKQMTVILNALLKSLNSLVYLFMLVFLMIFIFSLIGMQIYGGQMNYDQNADGYPGVPRQNYDSFYWAFQTCFQLFTQENWQVVLADTLRSPVNRGLTMIYHIAWMTVGNTILLNLLMGIMLDSLGSEEQSEMKDEQNGARYLKDKMSKKQGAELIEYFQASKTQQNSEQVPFGGNKKKKKKQNNENILDESFEFDQSNLNQDENVNFFKKKKENFEGNDCELSYYLFKKNNPLRLFLYKVSNHFIFEAFIQFVILLSSVKLVVDSYSKHMPASSPFFNISAGADYFFTAVFAVESLIKSISLGFVMDKGTYLRETWSQLDFFIVVTSMIDASFSQINIPVIKVLRLLRTLRPLRVISHNSAMKNIIGALIHSVSGIFYVAILLFIVWIMFAILAVTLIQGKLYSCSIDPYIYFTAKECSDAEGTWQNFPFNYDNVGIALISLFDISTMENWPDQRNAASDMSGTGTGPIRNNSLAYAYFFNAFIMIGTYIFLNLFIGVIFIKFQETQKEEVLQSNLSLKQQRWLDMMLMIAQATPDQETTNIPTNKFRKAIHSFVTGLSFDKKDKPKTIMDEKPADQLKLQTKKGAKKKKTKAKQQAEDNKNINKFEIFVMVIIAFNMIHLCLNYEGASAGYLKSLDYVNYVFTIVFLVEAILKLLAFGTSYFKNMQNVFDFFIVCTNILDIVMSFLSVTTMQNFKIGPQMVRVFRVLRLFRLYRLVKKFKGLNAMMDTILISLPTLMSTFALLLLVYFIFAILANFLFGDVTTGNYIDDYTNFGTFGSSMLTLIRASTGEDWNYIMMDCGLTTADNCQPGLTCGSSYNYMFFITFEVLQGFIMLNLFVLVITQQFDKYYMQDMNVLQLFKQDLAQFKELWTTFTLENTCIKIKDHKIMEFFAAMYEPLGMRPEDGDEKELMKLEVEERYKRQREKEDRLMKNIIKHVVTMDLDSDSDGYVYFNELLFKTLKRIYGEEHEKNRLVIEQELKTLKKIRQIKEFILKQQRKDLRLKALTVNPFVIKMFKHISFKSWVKLYRQNREKRFGQRQTEGDVTISEAGDYKDDEENNDANRYYYETEKDETCSEYDEDENEINSINNFDNISTLNKEISKLNGQATGPDGFKTQRDNLRQQNDKLNNTQQNFLQNGLVNTNRTNDQSYLLQRKNSTKTPNRANRSRIQHMVGPKILKHAVGNKIQSQMNSSKKRRSQNEDEDSIIQEFDIPYKKKKSESNSPYRRKQSPKVMPKISIESAQSLSKGAQDENGSNLNP